MSIEINLPEPHASLTAAFDRYEAALISNDVETLTELFAPGETTIRYGTGENLYGSAEIRAFRASRSPSGLPRKIFRTVITTYGETFGTASTLYRRDSFPGKVGRQMQSWVRFPEGWRVVAAHVSMIDEAPAG